MNVSPPDRHGRIFSSLCFFIVSSVEIYIYICIYYISACKRPCVKDWWYLVIPKPWIWFLGGATLNHGLTSASRKGHLEVTQKSKMIFKKIPTKITQRTASQVCGVSSNAFMLNHEGADCRSSRHHSDSEQYSSNRNARSFWDRQEYGPR